MIPSFSTIGYLALLALGFGFVVFWHELGHFLAAKWAGVRVEQFAVGFAHAVVSWRKGIGFRIGNTQKEFKAKVEQYLATKDPTRAPAESATAEEKEAAWTERERAEAADTLGLGETEYRLNWLPLGGYVKMVGQDDLRPNAEADDPRAYNRQSIPKRMVIVSAGVIMNVILAAVGFVILFSVGFHVPPTRVGSIQPNSPFQLAGGQIGDWIVTLDGKPQYNDWTKIQLNAALTANGEEIPVQVERLMPDGTKKTFDLTIKPLKSGTTTSSFVSLGIAPYSELKGPSSKDVKKDPPPANEKLLYADRWLLIRPDDVIVAVNDKEVAVTDFAALDAAIQTGGPVRLKIKNAAGAVRDVQFTPTFAAPFAKDQFDLLGMVPRQQVDLVRSTSPAAEKILPGDVLASISLSGSTDIKPAPSFLEFKKTMTAASDQGVPVKLGILRDGKPVDVPPLTPIKIDRDVYGLGVGLMADENESVIADVVRGSPAAVAGIPANSRVLSVNGKPIKGWREFHVAMREIAAGNPSGFKATLAVQSAGTDIKPYEITLAKADVDLVNNVRYEGNLTLAPTISVRIADGALDACKLGLIETRDFILQFYVTLKRMVTRDVSAANLMGPIGIFQTGTTIASKGNDWLLWFLSMISANLAVVNFLPIPIVDGGLFTFLIIEKIKGKPVSPKTQMIAQYVGLALLLSIFLFVTYQDIANFQFRMK